MSESFLIKKTAYNNAGTIAEHNAESFIIGPGELNGPGGLKRNSDMELYGFGAAKWGEGMDQNIFKLLENSACPRKEDNDFLMGTDDPVDFIPKNGSYNTLNDPVMPKDEYDLGIGNGITVPLLGQQWFDIIKLRNYFYNGINWIVSGIEPGTISIAAGTLSNNDLVCDGAEILRIDYVELFKKIGTTFGTPANSTLFKVPDLTAPSPSTGTVSYIIRT